MSNSIKDNIENKDSQTNIVQNTQDAEKQGGSNATLDKDQEYTIIIDIGQSLTKVGIAGDDKPTVFETITGTPKYKNLMADVSGMVQSIYVGSDCTRMRGVLKIDHPIQRGNVMNWDQYYAILNHIFYNVLRVEPSKCNVIYIIPPLTTPDISQYYARVLFETHHCKTVALLDSASTAAFSVGETTALAFEMGAGLTHVVPVMNGQIYPAANQRLNLGGFDVEEYLNALMTQYGLFQKREILKDIKERCVEVALNPTGGSADPSKTKDFVLPDGSTMMINSYVAIYAAEVLFNPTLLGYQVQSIQQAIINALRMVDSNYWRPLLNHIVLSGGGTLLKGFQERLEFEIKQLLPSLGTIPDYKPVEETIQQKTTEKTAETQQILFGNNKADNKDTKKLVQITEVKEITSSCPKCGETINTTESKFCPHCGSEVVLKQIDIIGSSKQKFPEKCPKCHKKLDGESRFCPNCGEKLEPVIVNDKLDKKEQKLIQKAAVSEKQIASMKKDVEEEYGAGEEISAQTENLSNMVQKVDNKFKKFSSDTSKFKIQDPTKIVQIISSENQEFASFKGAAVLGALPSFKKCLIDYQTFLQNPNLVIVDFARMLNL